MTNPTRGARPLYWQVADDIVRQIDTGQLNAGDKLPSERELCQRYQVSQITVRRALRELDHLNRVYSHHGLGWFVAEDSGISQVTQEVALITSHLDWMQAEMVELLQRRLAASGTGLHLVFAPKDTASLTKTALSAEAQGAQALLLTPTGPSSEIGDSLLDLYQRLGIPAMTWLYGLETSPLPSVTLDEQACMQTVAQHVLTLGHRRIAFAGADPNTLSGHNRFEGLVSLLYAQDMAVEYGWFFADDLRNVGTRDRFESLFAGHPRPDVMICASDKQAAQAMRLMNDLGLRCPHDLAIVGLGNREYSPYLPTPLTTLDFDLTSIADATARMLQQLLNGYSPESIAFTGKLVVRKSCGASI